MLVVRNLRKTFQATAVRVLFAGVDLTVAAGECVAITGESGVGKSTLLNIVAGLALPDEGMVHIDGQAMTGRHDDDCTVLRRSAIGFVYQAFHLLPYLNVLENVALPLKLLAWRDRDASRRALEVLGAVGLDDRAKIMPAVLSGGEQQRVAVARAVVHRPKLLLADEPTGNLDADNGARVLALLSEQGRASGAAILLVTHSRQAAAIADRVLVLASDGLRVRAPDTL
ncbi:MAG: ABC transporter ATP-binding protein [Betaproteobacteria bacterium]|nr:ABC transporter ATP-binding protein [Betaproteobacteria bacterium]